MTKYFSPISSIWRNSKRVIGMLQKSDPRTLRALSAVRVLSSTLPYLNGFILGMMTQSVVESVKLGSLTSQFWWAMFLIVATPVVIRIVDIFNDYLDGKYWIEMDNYMQLMYFKKRSALDIAAIKKPEIQNKARKAQESINKTRQYADRIFYSIGSLAGLTTAFAIFSTQNWWIFPVVVLATIPSLIVETKYGRKIWDIWGANTETRRKYNYFIDRLNDPENLSENKLLGTVNYFLKAIRETIGQFTLDQIRTDRNAVPARIFSAILSHGTTAGMIVIFAIRAARGQITVGELTFFYVTLQTLRKSISEIFSLTARQLQDNLYISDLFALLDQEPILIKPINPVTIAKNTTPDITLSKISFAYPSAPDKFVLQNISLAIPAGSRVALIGHNGAGKSTLLSMIFRFYDPDNGEVRIGEHDLRELDLENWYSHLGYIPQKYQFFQLRTADVIALGDTSTQPDERRIKQAAMKAGADTFINSWNKKYDQILGEWFEGGINISQGQMQKLALARIFYRNPRIWILDEPTSSIDAKSEIEVFEELNALPKDRTVIFISHRFSTVRNADQIVVLDKGKIKEQGTHRELVKKGGLYATLFKQQAKAYK